MPTEAEHDEAYRENRAFLASNGGLHSTNPRWAAVAAFYAAVHLVERLAARDGVDNIRHTGPQSRQLYLSHHPQHHVLLADLTALRSASELARYDSLTVFQAAWSAADVQAQLIDGHLAAIESYVAGVCVPAAAAASGS